MPMGNEDKLSPMFLMLYGQPGLRKTNWALNAAEAGFNVVLFDGDKGGGIVKLLSDKARARVTIINCFDKIDRPVFAEFLVRFMQNERLLWDDKDNKVLSQLVNTLEQDRAYIELHAQSLGPNDVVIVDGIRALIYSILWNHLQDNDVKIEELDKQDWDAYYMQKTLLETFFTRLRGCQCHMIWISHELVNELSEPGKDAKGNSIRKSTGEVVTQPLSSSRATGNVLIGYFDDALYFDIVGPVIFIDTIPNEKRQAKGRTFYGRKKWEDFQFADYAKLNGYVGDWSVSSKGCIYHPAGSITERPGVVRKKIEMKTATGGNGLTSPATQNPTPMQTQTPAKVQLTIHKATQPK